MMGSMTDVVRKVSSEQQRDLSVKMLTVVVSVGRGGEELLNHDTVQCVRARGCLVIMDDQIGNSHRANGKGCTAGTSRLDL